MSEWMRDVRHAVQVLAAQPGFAAVAILSLALAIGVNTTVLGVARAVLLKPLPVDRLEQIRRICWDSDKGARGVTQYNSTGARDPRTGRGVASNFSFPTYQAFRASVPQEIFAFTFLSRASISIENQQISCGTEARKA